MKSFSVQSLYNWYRDAIRNPKYRWWVILGSVAYLLMPFDLSPDLIPIVGWLDDGIIAGLLVAELSQILLERLSAGKTPDAPDSAAAAANASGVEGATVDVQAKEV